MLRPLKEEKASFQQMVLEKQICKYKRMKLGPYLTPHAQINLKWMKDLNIKVKMIKLLERSLGEICVTLDLPVISWM